MPTGHVVAMANNGVLVSKDKVLIPFNIVIIAVDIVLVPNRDGSVSKDIIVVAFDFVLVAHIRVPVTPESIKFACCSVETPNNLIFNSNGSVLVSKDIIFIALVSVKVA